MSEFFEDEEEKAIVADEEFTEVENIAVIETRHRPASDARRRLENMLDEKRLRDELEDFIDY